MGEPDPASDIIRSLFDGMSSRSPTTLYPRATLGKEIQSRSGVSDRDSNSAVSNEDRNALVTRLFQEHADAVYGYCYRMLRDTALAEDIVQHTFLEVWHNLERFQGRSSFRTWLFSIAVHRTLDKLRAQNAERRLLETLETETEAEAVPDPTLPADEQIDNERWRDALRHCIGNLSPETRIALTLRFADEHTYEEMAELIAVHVDTLRARVVRALPALLRCIEARLGRR